MGARHDLATAATGTPPEQLRAMLTRARRDGEEFFTACSEALEVIAWPRSRREAIAWRQVLEATINAWHSAYDRGVQEHHGFAELVHATGDDWVDLAEE